MQNIELILYYLNMSQNKEGGDSDKWTEMILKRRKIVQVSDQSCNILIHFTHSRNIPLIRNSKEDHAWNGDQIKYKILAFLIKN